MNVVDSHVHIFPPEVSRHRSDFVRRDKFFAELYGNPKSRIADAEMLIESMDEGEVKWSIAVGFGWQSQDLCAWHNDYLVECLRAHPDRIVALACVQPTDPRAVGEVERRIGEGFAGVGELMPHGQGYRLDDFATSGAIAETVQAAGAILMTHSSEPVGHIYPGKGSVHPQQVAALATRYPKLKLIAAHWGGGLLFYELMPEVRAAFSNVYYDSAASSLLYERELFRIAPRLAEPHRILFATDYPLLKQKRQIEKVLQAGLDSEYLRRFLGGNAEDLFAPWKPEKRSESD